VIRRVGNARVSFETWSLKAAEEQIAAQGRNRAFVG
jgi:hypothetical protein